MIITEAIAVIIYLFIVFPLFMNAAEATNFGSVSVQPYLWGNKSIAFQSANPFIYFIGLLEMSRLYLISFNLHFLNASKNEKWKSQIDTSIANKNWYIRNKQRYGNPRKAVTFFMLVWLIVAVTVDISYYIDYNIGTIANACFFFSGISTIFFIYWQCRHYHALDDNLLFHYEFRATVIIWVLSVVFFVIAEALRIISGDKYEWKLIAGIINGIVSVFASVAPSLLSTLWIPRKFAGLASGHRETLVSMTIGIEMGHDTDNGTVNCDAGQDETMNSSSDRKLFSVLKNEQRFEKFVQWMYRDFSSEAILGFIEMVQFKKCFVEEMDYQNWDSSGCLYMDSLYTNVPKSSIVYSDDAYEANGKGMERMKRVAHRLCDKYVRVNAEFEVNIAYKLRKKISLIADGDFCVSGDEFFKLFDRVLDDLFTFMRQSFERYMDQREPSVSDKGM